MVLEKELGLGRAVSEQTIAKATSTVIVSRALTMCNMIG
jgi:hypothetical protein